MPGRTEQDYLEGEMMKKIFAVALVFSFLLTFGCVEQRSGVDEDSKKDVDAEIMDEVGGQIGDEIGAKELLLNLFRMQSSGWTAEYRQNDYTSTTYFQNRDRYMVDTQKSDEHFREYRIEDSEFLCYEKDGGWDCKNTMNQMGQKVKDKADVTRLFLIEPYIKNLEDGLIVQNVQMDVAGEQVECFDIEDPQGIVQSFRVCFTDDGIPAYREYVNGNKKMLQMATKLTRQVDEDMLKLPNDYAAQPKKQVDEYEIGDAEKNMDQEQAIRQARAYWNSLIAVPINIQKSAMQKDILTLYLLNREDERRVERIRVYDLIDYDKSFDAGYALRKDVAKIIELEVDDCSQGYRYWVDFEFSDGEMQKARHPIAGYCG